jgi:hypothetical protein
MSYIKEDLVVKKWARVGMTIEVDESLWKENQIEAVMDAFRKGKAALDGETYFPIEATVNDGAEIDMQLSGTIKLVD